MKQQPVPYADNYRQFKFLSEKVNKFIRTGKFGELSQTVQEKMLNKLKYLYNKLSSVYSIVSLKKILATAAVFLGLSTVTNAQIFAPAVKDSFNLQPAGWSYPSLIDLDGDGDLDVLTGGTSGQFHYYQNTGTKSSPIFVNPVTNPFGLTSLSFIDEPVVADLDGDGDYDLLSRVEYGQFQYYQNTGTKNNPNFAAPSLNPFGLNPGYYNFYFHPTLIDIDGDGDLDLFIGGFDKIQFHKNIGNAQTAQFDTPINNPFNITIPPFAGTVSAGFADLDFDGDFDIILAGQYFFYDTELGYLENIGTPQNPSFIISSVQVFFTNQLNNFSTFGISLADLDNDGDMDMLFGGRTYDPNTYDGEESFYYFKNTSDPIGIADLPQLNINVAPNPASEILHIQFENATNSKLPNSLTIVNIKGQQLIREKINSNSIQLDVSLLPPGNYFVVLRNNERVVGRKKISIIEK